MGRLRGRIKQVLDAAADEKSTLVCPECGEEFTVYGDAALQFLAHDWGLGYEGETYQKTPEDILRLTEHEHDPTTFIDERGDPWLGELFRGSRQMLSEPAENVPDLSEGG